MQKFYYIHSKQSKGITVISEVTLFPYDFNVKYTNKNNQHRYKLYVNQTPSIEKCS